MADDFPRPMGAVPVSDELQRLLRDGGPLHVLVGELPTEPAERLLTVTNVSGRAINIGVIDTGELQSGRRLIDIHLTLQPRPGKFPPELLALPAPVSITRA